MEALFWHVFYELVRRRAFKSDTLPPTPYILHKLVPASMQAFAHFLPLRDWFPQPLSELTVQFLCHGYSYFASFAYEPVSSARFIVSLPFGFEIPRGRVSSTRWYQHNNFRFLHQRK